MIDLRSLNIGCGESSFCTDRIDIRKTSTTTLVCDVENGLPFPDNTFFLVYSKNNLEHLANVGFHLKECLRVLRPGGKICLRTDNASCWRFYVFGTHTGKYEKLHSGDHHFCIFTKSHLKNHFEQAGFRDINIFYVKTDTLGKWLDLFTFQHPRIRVVAHK